MSTTPYFIGINLPEKLSEQLFSFKWDTHRDISHSLKPLVPHITLLHPSSLSSISKQDILPKIQAAAVSFLPFNLTLDAFGSFSTTVFYISVRSPELEALQEKLVTLLPPNSQEIYNKQGYQPHVTLVQTKPPHSLDLNDLHQRADQIIGLPLTFSINSISCFTQQAPRDYQATTL